MENGEKQDPENRDKNSGAVEYLKAREVGERLHCSHIHISKLASLGALTRDKDFLFKWPDVREEFRAYEEKRKRKPAPRISKKQAEDIDIGDEEVFSQTSIQTIIDLLRKGASENAASLALHYAKALKEVINSKLVQIELLEAEGKTLDRTAVEKWLYTISKQNRDQWLAWPQTISNELAEKYGIDARLLNEDLTDLVRKNLERIAILPVEFESTFDESLPEGTETSDPDGGG